MDWIELTREFGPYISMLLFLTWRDYRREESLVKQINDINEFVRSELVDLVEKTTRALNNER